jgi:transposase
MYFNISTRAKKLEARRKRACTYFTNGKSQAWVADKLGVTTAAACKWHAAWQKDKKKGVLSKGRCGVKSEITKEKLQRVKKKLEQGATKSGFTTDLWTLERLRTVFKRETKQDYHVGHVWKIMTRTLGWTNQKPVRRARERNEAAIKHWRTVEWPAIQKKGSNWVQP